MNEKFFVDSAGHYLGAFVGANPPPGAVEVPSAPADARQTWDGKAWLPFSPVPASVTPLQMRRALRKMGLKGQADAYLTTVSEEAREAWEYATAIEYGNEFIEAARVALGMSEAQKADLFRRAATL